LAAVGTSHAALLDEGNGQLYDNVTDLVWQQNANLAATNTFGLSGIDTNGRMTWGTAQNWIAAMNANDYLGHSDWMLPSVSPVNGKSFNYNYSIDGTTDRVYNITSSASPLSYMYYVNLGLKAPMSPLDDSPQPDFGVFRNGTWGGQADIGIVKNLQSNGYWTSTAYDPVPGYVWYFDTQFGAQGGGTQYYYGLNAWAVRPADAGDIAAAIPEPETYLMLLAGLGLLGFVARSRKYS